MRPVECGMVSLGSQESGSGFIRSEGEYDHSSKEADSPGQRGQKALVLEFHSHHCSCRQSLLAHGWPVTLKRADR